MKVGPAFLQTFAIQLLQTIASIAAGIIIARGLGPEGQGQYAVLLAGVGLLATLAAAGQFEGNVLTSAGEQSRGRVLLVRSAIQATLAGMVALLSMGLWRSVAAIHDGAVAPLLSLIVMMEVLALLFRGINLGQHEITAYNIATLVQRFAYLAILAALGAVIGLRLTVVLKAWLAAVGLNAVLTGFGIWRRSQVSAISWRVIRNGWLVSLNRGLRALLTVCLTLVLIRVDVYMLGRWLGTEAVGQISVATTFAEYLWYIPSILGSMLFALVAAGNTPENIDKICRSSRSIIALIAPVALVLMIVGRSLIPLVYGGAYSEAGRLFVLLVPGMLAISVHLVVDSYFAGSGFPPISYFAAGGALLSKVALNLAVVPRFGVAGAAVATSVVYTLLLLVKVVTFGQYTGVSVHRVLVPTWSDMMHTAQTVRAWLVGTLRVSGG